MTSNCFKLQNIFAFAPPKTF